MNFVVAGTNFISDAFSATKRIEQFSLYAFALEQQTGESFTKHDMTDAKVFTNIEQVCQDPVDAVYIAAPNSLHRLCCYVFKASMQF